jgi:hypothetical protein
MLDILEAEVGRLQFKDSPNNMSSRSYLHIKAKAQNNGVTAQVIECLPSRCKTLSPVPSTTKTEKKEY